MSIPKVTSVQAPPSIAYIQSQADSFLYVTHLLIAHEFDVALSYNDMAEKWFLTSEESLDSLVKRISTGMSEAQRNEYLDAMSDEHWEVSEAFPQLSRKALLVLGGSLFESSLVTLCRAAHHTGLVSAPLSNQRQRHIYQNVQDYMTHSKALPRSAFDGRWKRLDYYRQIRNIIVHNHGYLTKPLPLDPRFSTYQKLRAFIGREKTITLDSRRNIVLGPTCCGAFLKAAREWCADAIINLDVSLP